MSQATAPQPIILERDPRRQHRWCFIRGPWVGYWDCSSETPWRSVVWAPYLGFVSWCTSWCSVLG